MSSILMAVMSTMSSDLDAHPVKDIPQNALHSSPRSVLMRHDQSPPSHYPSELFHFNSRLAARL